MKKKQQQQHNTLAANLYLHNISTKLFVMKNLFLSINCDTKCLNKSINVFPSGC